MKINLEDRYDVEKSWLVRGAVYDDEDIPIIETTSKIPTSLLSFSRSKKATDFSHWVHFYEPDTKFAQLWNNPKNYVHLLKRFGGIISPDYSIYADSPIPVQQFNKYRNHALAYWLSTQGVPVVPNVRWANERSFDFCFKGIEKNSVVAVGTHGQMKATASRELFKNGLPVMVSTLSPHTIIVYGKAPDDIFGRYKDAGIRIVQFTSETERYHKHRKVVA